MKATNITRGAVLHGDVRVAHTLDKMVKGLRGSAAGEALFFKTRWGVHTFSMKFAIDCLVLDNNMKVAALRANLVPGRLFFWNPRHRNVLELPAGTIARTGTEVGDTLTLVA